MSFLGRVKSLFFKFEDLILANHSCISCGREIPDGSKFSLCTNCLENVNKICGNICAKCGDLLLENSMVCDNCKDKNYVFSSSRSYCYYDEISEGIVKNLKYSGNKFVANHIADMMAENLDYFDGVDLITFVPLSKKRKKFRGFNQAEEIAKILGEKFNIKVENLLLKFDNGKNQAGLNQKQRLENLKGSFGVDYSKTDMVKNKNILIIDDVFTTGTTLNECSIMLKKLKPKNIFCYTFAKTKFNNKNL